jgi:hypothetical protein
MKSEKSMAGKYSKTVGTCSDLARTCFMIGKTKFYSILAGKMSGIGIIAEFCRIPRRLQVEGNLFSLTKEPNKTFILKLALICSLATAMPSLLKSKSAQEIWLWISV